MPSTPASPSFAQSSRSKLSSPASTSLSRSCVSSPWRIFSTRPLRSSCSSLKEKSIALQSLSLPGGQGHAKTEHCDQIALDLVGAAAEREDDQAAVRVLQSRLQDRS